MTTTELKTLFDRLGPEWRVFVRLPDPEEPPTYEWLTSSIIIPADQPADADGWMTIAFGDTTGVPIYMDIQEPEIVVSDDRGHLLRAQRRDPVLTIAEFSTLTLTPAMLRSLASPSRSF